MHAPRTFAPDHRNIGGAHDILNQLGAHYRRVDHAGTFGATETQYVAEGMDGARRLAGVLPGRPRPSDKCITIPSAAQLSKNKARRKRETDLTGPFHRRNVYHMCRRMQDMYSLPERMKNPADIIAHPPHIRKKPSNVNATAMALCPWIPNNPYCRTRPSTAPSGGRAMASDAAAGTRQRGGEPALSAAAGAPAASLYQRLKARLLQVIVEQRLYKEKTLRAFFERERAACSADTLPVMVAVISELERELDVVS
ncbi:unnamed protein product [Pedinophyceae sp. YPF-701]|nr:unnamed protein product [Pedinophyceae sp. YPF-701]